MNQAPVEFRHVSKQYGPQGAVVDLSLLVPAGEICVLVGPSGCGKTTSLKMVNRLVEPSSGQVLIDGHDVMTGEVHTVREDTPLNEIVDTMERRRIKRVPVLSGRKLVGIITRSNLLRAFAGLSRATPESSASDATIREAFVAELKKQSWAPLAATVRTVAAPSMVTR